MYLNLIIVRKRIKFISNKFYEFKNNNTNKIKLINVQNWLKK